MAPANKGPFCCRYKADADSYRLFKAQKCQRLLGVEQKWLRDGGNRRGELRTYMEEEEIHTKLRISFMHMGNTLSPQSSMYH